ncbi:MAG TPA: hypothetical protein VKV04_21570 [Verrucomicrobiae bacterium]|nr:hypothetical protein [Verrucomicrobiae bacterium]
MLFALLDYLRYRARQGNYTTASIRAQGGRLAVSENFPGVETFGPDYIFGYHRVGSVMSWAVMYYTSSIWAHVGHFSENGCVLDVTTTAGVCEHPFFDYLDGKSFVGVKVSKTPFTPSQRAKMLAWGRQHIGERFSWEKIVIFFFAIVLGAHKKYRFRFSADFAIVALVLSPIALVSKRFGQVLAALAILYAFAVIVNTPKRRKMARFFSEQGMTE